MSATIINEDSRSIKTKKALYGAMLALLKKYSFKKITIKGICEEASISRAAFYAHFIDKYDLLEHWVAEIWPKDFNSSTYEQIEKAANYHVHKNIPVLKNLVYDADNETFGVLFDFLLSTINLTVERDKGREEFAKSAVLSNFYAGGMLSYFMWQVKNNFPPDVPLMNRSLYKMLHELQGWQSK